jgi:arylsulfatase A-like enzyme
MGSKPGEGDVKPWRVIEQKPWTVNETEELKEEAKEPEKKEEEPVKDEVKEAEKKEEAKKPERELSPKKKPLNILLLYGDDWRHDSLGSASNGLVKTPFLDKLATEGIRFTHNCVTTSVCWISRATLYSGKYVSQHNSTQPTTPYFYDGWNQSFPFLLREKGYYFGHVGKWHFPTEFLQDKLDFQRMYYGSHWYETKDGPIHTTKRNEKDAIDFLRERPKDQPFCLTVCFFTPHSVDGTPEQYFPQNESMTLYVDDTIPLAPSATEEAWKKMPSFFGDLNEGRYRYRLRFDTPEKHQKMMKNYYRLISEIDSTSGKLLFEVVVVNGISPRLLLTLFLSRAHRSGTRGSRLAG